MNKIKEQEHVSEKIKIIEFKKDPSFARLWDACIYNLLYKKDEYVKEIENLFSQKRVGKNSKILDSSAGGGFPAVHLRADGYDVSCMDLMDDEIEVFKERARENGVSQKISKIAWKEIPKNYKKGKFDFIFCRGNSFIYADGGWNKNQEVNQKNSLESYEETLKIFYYALKSGGYLYLDKFPDNEKLQKETVAKIKVEGKLEELIFFTEKIPEKGMRRASMIRKNSNGIETGIPNVTYNLSGTELEEIMGRIGFEFEKIKIKSETHFDVWLARKK